MGSLALAGCTTASSTPGVINVVAAENQYGDVLDQIGGVYVHVTSVMSNPNTDPHNFEASPRIAQQIAAARVVVQNGDGYDAFMNQLESASASSSRTVVVVSQLRHATSAVNPHLWYDPATMPAVAGAIATDLARIAPRHAAYFHARDVTFLRQWAQVSALIAQARRHDAGESVATTEPVADYLLTAMGLRIRTPFRFEADVMNGVDPSPEDIVTQQDLLARHEVRAFCFNAQVSSPVTLALRRLAAADHVATVAVYETMPSGLHVQSWMLAEIHAIENALARGVSTGRLA
jgi:zinc/manganese transport system substrate-binding protein